MWTTIIARVRDVIFAATCSTSMFQVSEHASTTTGVAPARIIAAAQEIIVNVGRMTSSPFFRSSAVTDTSKAADPLQTATAYLRPSLFATPASSRLTNAPSEEIQPLRTHSTRYLVSLPSSNGSFTGIKSRLISVTQLFLRSKYR